MDLFSLARFSLKGVEAQQISFESQQTARMKL
jgi:hypothetical protein